MPHQLIRPKEKIYLIKIIFRKLESIIKLLFEIKQSTNETYQKTGEKLYNCLILQQFFRQRIQNIQKKFSQNDIFHCYGIDYQKNISEKHT